MAPTLPNNAPFTAEQQAWLNGYLAGLFCDEASRGQPAPGRNRTAAEGSKTPPKAPLLILFGSQTGTAERVAKKLAKEASTRGYPTHLHPLNDHDKAHLEAASHAVIVTSTWGDGDPPENATQFWSHVSAEGAPRFGGLRYAVLGLGDKNYPEFCGAARKIYARLEQLGAQPITALGECDVDYKPVSEAWAHQLWQALESPSDGGHAPSPPIAPSTLPAREEIEPTSVARACLPAFSRNNPFPGRLKTNRRLNLPGSSKDTRHFEIAIDSGAIRYTAGDALGVMPRNCPALVEELLATLGFDGNEAVSDEGGGSTPLQEALVQRLSLASPAMALLKAVAERCEEGPLPGWLKSNNSQELSAWLWGRDIVDVIRPMRDKTFSAQDFVALLQPLRPRLYSISSSPKMFPEEIHLTVAVVRYEAHGRSKKGVCSTFLAERVALDGSVPVFVQASHGFKPPTDPNAPMIMVGPGTGIAPFMAFLQDRRADGAQGPHWLFFGDQRRATDYLYGSELEAWREEGFLNRLDLAFSRDQERKVYVQDKMIEHGAELWKWLEGGAHFYVCGDAKRMAKDVDAALHSIARTVGGLSDDNAAEYIDQLKETKRYQRDVY